MGDGALSAGDPVQGRTEVGRTRLLAEAVTELVCVDGSGRPRRLPDDVRRALRSDP